MDADRRAYLCVCWHPESDHESNEGACVYGWDDWQALDDEEREADPCDCEGYVASRVVA